GVELGINGMGIGLAIAFLQLSVGLLEHATEKAGIPPRGAEACQLLLENDHTAAAAQQRERGDEPRKSGTDDRDIEIPPCIGCFQRLEGRGIPPVGLVLEVLGEHVGHGQFPPCTSAARLLLTASTTRSMSAVVIGVDRAISP